MSGQLTLTNWILPNGQKGADPGAPLGKMQRFAKPQQRCANKDGHGNRCKWWFDKPAEDDVQLKWCPRCRRTGRRNNKNGTEAAKASKRKHKLTEKFKKTTAAWKKGKRGKASNKRYKTGEKGKAAGRKESSKPMSRLSQSLAKLLAGVPGRGVNFRALGTFVDNDDVIAHFESTFAPWMSWDNKGPKLADTAPNTRWQNGHRIPKAWYRHNDLKEAKKCWSRANLFAQCAVENITAGDRNILSRDQWQALKTIWPKQCDNMTDDEAWEWASNNVDNATRNVETSGSESD